MRKELLLVAASDIALYLIQFIIVPLIYSNVIGRSNEGIVVIIISTAIVTIIGMIVLSNKLRFWLVSIVLFALLIILYSPKGAYGIGVTGIDLDGLHSHYDVSARFLGISIIIGLVLFTQFAIWCIIKLVLHLGTVKHFKF